MNKLMCFGLKLTLVGIITSTCMLSKTIAQNLRNINGFVRQAKTQVPLQGVTIKILSTDKQAVTDRTGFYRIRSVTTKSYTIVATSVGYKPV